MITEKEFDESLQYYFNKGETIETMRDDIRLRSKAIQLGYTPQYGKNFGDCVTFKKDVKHIWRIRDGWRCADIIEGFYTNHRTYEDLEVALESEV